MSNLQPLPPPTLPPSKSKSQVVSLDGIEGGGYEGGVVEEASLFLWHPHHTWAWSPWACQVFSGWVNARWVGK